VVRLHVKLQDFWSVYHDKLGFLKSVNEKDILLRTSTELRTHQVAGGLLYGMDPNVQAATFPVHCQPENGNKRPPSPCIPQAYFKL
jgi:2-phosphoxylose phosphatase